MRTSIHKYIADPKEFKHQILTWSQSFREIIFLDSNNNSGEYQDFDMLLAVDAFTSIKTDYHNAFEDLKQYQQTTADWIFGFLAYDLKNDLEILQSDNFDGLTFPDLFFFQPKKIFILKGNELEIKYLNLCNDEINEDFNAISETHLSTTIYPKINISQRISQEAYIAKTNKMLEYIRRGDIYEANFCMEFFSKNAVIDPLDCFLKLNTISLPPFAVFFKAGHHFLLSASPERYLKRENDRLISQPIKGTAARYENPVDDEKSKFNLSVDIKERSENIMITDLVRNDLSRTAQKGTVAVEELCGVYSFLQVHHMISTITSKLNPNFSAVDALKTTFPMGSMTGAPKISAMQIIETLEETKRGLYSGAIGYFTPDGDFDFNVVIRSILYNREKKYVSFSVGSAITSLSVPEKEYEECLLKAKAMYEVLG